MMMMMMMMIIVLLVAAHHGGKWENFGRHGFYYNEEVDIAVRKWL
jgi:hypothetical protein